MNTFVGNPPVVRMLPDGRRMHCQHGPIDLIIEANGKRSSVLDAYREVTAVFGDILGDLMSEIAMLRAPLISPFTRPTGNVAGRMWQAASRHADSDFVTPMIAVAGSVADHILGTIKAVPGIDRAYVNNGGDIALYLAPNQQFSIAICSDLQVRDLPGRITVKSDDRIGGIATSGWRGRSHSLGIADAVTVLAADAATADTAATLIANAVDIPGSPKIVRVPANQMDPDSDLGSRPVTNFVAELTINEIHQALFRGEQKAHSLIELGRVRAVFLALKNNFRTVQTGDMIQEIFPSTSLTKETVHA